MAKQEVVAQATQEEEVTPKELWGILHQKLKAEEESSFNKALTQIEGNFLVQRFTELGIPQEDQKVLTHNSKHKKFVKELILPQCGFLPNARAQILGNLKQQ